MRTTFLALALLAALAEPASAGWRPPVNGSVARAFAYARDAPFRAGAHRGVDLAARPGEIVRAACAGEVVTASVGGSSRARGVADRVPGGPGAGVVTLRCGPWRVTALPLASVAVARGARVPAGAVIGRVGAMAGHTGLHVGVRRADDRFAYVDPAPMLRDGPRPPVTVAPRTAVPRTGSRVPSPRVAAPDPASPPSALRGTPAPASPRAVSPGPAAVSVGPAAVSENLDAPPDGGVRVRGGGVAPWPAWVGLGLLAVGGAGTGVRIRVRRARARAEVAVPSAP